MARLSLFPLMKKIFSPVQSKTSILPAKGAGGSSFMGLVGCDPVVGDFGASSLAGVVGGTNLYRKDSPVP